MTRGLRKGRLAAPLTLAWAVVVMVAGVASGSAQGAECEANPADPRRADIFDGDTILPACQDAYGAVVVVRTVIPAGLSGALAPTPLANLPVTASQGAISRTLNTNNQGEAIFLFENEGATTISVEPDDYIPVGLTWVSGGGATQSPGGALNVVRGYPMTVIFSYQRQPGLPLSISGTADRETTSILVDTLPISGMQRSVLRSAPERTDELNASPISSIDYAGTPISSIPISSIPISSIPISSIPISSIPISSIPISSIAPNEAALAAVPIRDIPEFQSYCAAFKAVNVDCTKDSLFDILSAYAGTNAGLAGSPISSIRLTGLPISSIPISSIPISSIPISSIPISSITWEEILEGTPFEGVPTHKVTLQDLLDLPDGRGHAILDELTLGEADLFALGLSRADVYAFLLGGAPVSTIDGGSFCALYEDDFAEDGFTCGENLLAEQVAGSHVSGAPISSIPISSIPISSIPISSIPISSIPISSIPISSIEALRSQLIAIPAGSVPALQAHCNAAIKSLDLDCATTSVYDVLRAFASSPGGLAGSPISSITVEELGPAGTPISSIPISSIPISSIPISSIPISSIPISSIAVLDAIPISSIAIFPLGPLSVGSIDELCKEIASDLGLSEQDCRSNKGIGSDGSAEFSVYDVLMAYDTPPNSLENSPFAGLPISSIPISSIPLASIPISSIPISSIPISSIPISSIPISSIETHKSALQTITLGSMSEDFAQFCQEVQPLLPNLPCGPSTTLYGLLKALKAAGELELDGPSLQGLTVAGSPISSIPISSIPISSIVVSTPISSIPISSIPAGVIAAHRQSLEAISAGTIAAFQPHCGRIALAGLDCENSSLFEVLDAYAHRPGGLAGSPISSIELQALPISSILVGLPISSIPISSIPISSISVNGSPISSIPISSIQVDASSLVSVPISSIGAIASSPISSIPISSIDFSGTPISSITLDRLVAGQPACGAGGWVEAKGLACAFLRVDGNSTLAALTRALDDLGIAPEAGPLALPISSIDIENLEIDGYAFTAIPISSIRLESLPISSIPISSIVISGTPISSIALPTDPNLRGRLATCSPAACATFGDVAAAGAFKPGVTVGDVAEAVGGPVRPTLALYFSGPDLGSIADTLGDVTFGQLVEHSLDTPLGQVSVKQLLDLLDPTGGNTDYQLAFFLGDVTIGELYADGGSIDAFTMEDLVFALLDRDELAWEEAAFESIDPPVLLIDEATTQLTEINYTLAVSTILGGPGELTVQLPPTFRYVAKSAIVNGSAIEPGMVGTAAAGIALTWAGLQPSQGTILVTFTANPGFRITMNEGDHDLRATIAFGDDVATTTVPMTVVESFEIDTQGTEHDRSNPFPIKDGIVYLGHIGRPGDVDYFVIEVPDGVVVSTFISQPGGDPNGAMFVPDTEVAAEASTESAGRMPANDLRADIATEVAGRTLGETGTIPSTEPVSDDRIVGASSEQAGTSEVLHSDAPLEGGKYILRVEGNGQDAWDTPYAIRVKFSRPRHEPVCRPPAFVFAGQGVAGGPATLSGDLTTLFVVNQQRLGDAFGPAAAKRAVDELTALATFVNSAPFPGTAGILFVENDAAIAAAYEVWDANPCDTAAANGVVEKINIRVDEIRMQSATQLQHIVLVGGDEIIPFFRTPDPTLRWNERHYAADVTFGSAYWGALVTGHTLTDTPYGDLDPTPWLNRFLFLPEIAVGRLVETPDDIVSQAKAFIASNGLLAPNTGLSVGYDFLTDGAEEIARGFEDESLGTSTLINDTWDGAEFLRSLPNSASASPRDLDVLSLNAHFDHKALLTAAGDASATHNELVHTGDLQWLAPGGTVIFSMGCHAGLNVAGYLAGSPGTTVTEDWAETLTRYGAVFIANTGYGYGDTVAVGLTERLMSLYGQQLIGHSRDAGQALLLAQHAYYGSLGVYGVYDEKVLMQSTFYGLPMYRLGALPGGAHDNPGPALDPLTGLLSADLSVFPSFRQVFPASVLDSQTRYWEAIAGESEYLWNSDPSVRIPILDADVQLTHDRPIQPRVAVDVTQSGWVAHGAVIESIIGQGETTPVTPVFSQPVIDEAGARSYAAADGGAFPIRFQNLTTYLAADGQRFNLVLLPGQFYFDEAGAGTQRLFDRVDARVYYHNASDDFVRPDILSTRAVVDSASVTYMVDVEDRVRDDEIGEANGEVKRVLLLQRFADESWRAVELTRQGTSTTWMGASEFDEDLLFVEYFVQAVDGAGNVTVETNKGRFFKAPTTGSADELTIRLFGSSLLNNPAVFAGPVLAVISSPANAAIEYILDGSAPQPYTGPFVVTEAGTHFIEASAAGDSASRSFAIGTGPSTGRRIEIQSPQAGAAYAQFAEVYLVATCNDVGLGAADCTGIVGLGTTVPTSRVRMETVVISVRDALHREFSQAVSYTVGDVCALEPTIVAVPGGGVVEGTPGDDIIHGTSGPDTINGHGGNDIICSFGGDDTIDAGEGNDFVDAGPGDDTVVASSGHNLVRLGPGDDSAITGGGDDYIGGEAGNDTLNSGAGNDTNNGGSGDDEMLGGDGTDVCIANGSTETVVECEAVLRP